MGFEDKYDFKENKTIKHFHQSRIMFAIHNNKLYVADKTTDSHATWFKSMGWIDEVNDSLMNIIVRGYVDNSGIYFYKGYDFTSTETDEVIFKSKAKELKEILAISDNSPVYAGVIKQVGVSKFPPKKFIGKLSDIIS